ncbi:MAG: Lrp/AsnC ligand binding domain-containing protein [Thermoproteota archaeon]
MIKVGPGFSRERTKKILEVEGIEEIFELTGDIDMLIKVRATDIEDLSRTVFRIREIKGVVETDTRMIISSQKA